MKARILFVSLFVVIACDRSSVTTLEETNLALEGSWLLYETGMSPGAGYIITPVPDNPPQVVKFLDGRLFVSNMSSMHEYSFFVTEYDSKNNLQKIRILQKDPSSGPDADDREFYVEMTNTNLKLMPVGCIEGCHLAFRKQLPVPNP